MSEIILKHVNALVVSEVEPGSPAARAGIQIGDLLKKINGKPILDILDFRFHATDTRQVWTIERSGTEQQVPVRKRDSEDIGLAFEQDLGDRVHTCNNKCVFCFIHQMPRKMRKSLYLMDDDFRLSFMHGNYVTLTNLSPDEWTRILEQKLSPLYVSVHATDPELRKTMLGRREPAPILPQIRELADHRIDVHAQIVLCPGWNDEEHLDQTLADLALEHPSVTGKRAGLQSVAIVPVGMTRFRERLPQLTHVERDYARAMIRRVRAKDREFNARLGTRFAWLADEWYYIAELPFPGRAHYENFPQLEDGIGTVRLFLDQVRQVSRRLPERMPVPVNATLVTAEMPAPLLRALADRLNQIENVSVNVLVVKNEFFGGDIHIAGLLTATDILTNLQNFVDCHDTVYIPKICLRDGIMFLDDKMVEDLALESGRDIRVVGTTPRDLALAMGLLRGSASPLKSPTWVMEDTITP